MPALYDKLGIRFQYPENWTLETDDTSSSKPTVTVYSPQGAFWTVMLHPLDSDPAELAKAAMETLQGEYDEIDIEEASEEAAGVELVGYDLNFYCLDLTNTASIRAGQNSLNTYLIVSQAEDRDLAKVSPVFQAMTISLLSK
jgi:hypothetical protein